MNLLDLTTDQLFDLNHELTGVVHILSLLCLDYLGTHPYGTSDPAYLALAGLLEQVNAEACGVYQAFLDKRLLERAAGDEVPR